MRMIPEIPALYDVARTICHDMGIPWTDPRTGKTYPPPKAATPSAASKRKPRPRKAGHVRYDPHGSK